jgi:mannosyltransferase
VSRRRLALPAILVLAAALRFATLHLQSYWLDEAVTVRLLHRGLFDMLGQLPHSESTPPLYYVVAWVWARIFGYGEVGLRSLSALAGVATVGVVWACGRRLGGERAAVAAAVIAATAPLLVWYSQEARSYALLTLLCAASVLAFLHVLEGERGARALIAWATVSALALATHYFAGFLVAPEAAWLLWRGRTDRRALAAVGVVVAVAAALVPLALAQRNTGNADFIAGQSFATRLVQVPKQLLIGYGAPGQVILGVIAAAIAAVAAISLARAGAAERAVAGAPAGQAERGGAAVPLVLAVAALALPLLLAAGGLDFVISRNLLVAWPPLALAAALGLARLGRAGTGLLAAAAAVGLAAVIGVEADRSYQRDDWRDAIHAATRDGAPPRALALAPASGVVPLAVYAPRAGPLPPAGAAVREIDVVALAVRHPGRGLVLPRLATPPTPPGFQLVERRTTSTYTLVRFAAPQPTPVNAGLVAAHAFAAGPPAVLLDPR